MSNQEKKNGTEGQQVTDQQGQQAPAQNQTPEGQQQVVNQTEEKLGFGGWLKKHWKGVTATVLGVGTAVGTSIAAYKKGKAAGVASVPCQYQEEDYSLNPNQE